MGNENGVGLIGCDAALPGMEETKHRMGLPSTRSIKQRTCVLAAHVRSGVLETIAIARD